MTTVVFVILIWDGVVAAWIATRQLDQPVANGAGFYAYKALCNGYAALKFKLFKDPALEEENG